jgi:hypothetical protein
MEYYYKNCINYLVFRLRFITNLIKSNNIDKTKVFFYYNKNKPHPIGFTDLIDTTKINNFKVNYDISNENLYETENEEYIIFHTKTRFFSNPDKTINDLYLFEKFIHNFYSKYKIIILGEKRLPLDNKEIKDSTSIITQKYDIFVNLENNNDVIDKTLDTFVDNLNYDNFIKDIQLIQNAKYNIHFGGGGSSTFSLIFGNNNTVIYYNDIECNFEELKKENTFFYNDVNDFISKIKNDTSSNMLNIYKNPQMLKNISERVAEMNRINYKLCNQTLMDSNVTNGRLKTTQNLYFLCHGGLGDLFNHCAFVRFLSHFYNKIYLFCS